MRQNGIFHRAVWIDQDIIDLPEFFPLRIADCRSNYLAGPLPSLQGSTTRLSRDLARKEDANYRCAQPKTALFHNNLLCQSVTINVVSVWIDRATICPDAHPDPSPLHGASDLFSQGDRRHVAIGFDRSQLVQDPCSLAALSMPLAARRSLFPPCRTKFSKCLV